ncbi:MAG: type I restriction-modification system subunit M N-terminal domain-containing protein [Deltaproteobacteria bacterium]|nr:type I restriction-modification system subunit M N-terminal domain-containing protein [Deltaproteobacteria bacterium]
MINGELRSQVDKLWTEFWTGGITNPLVVIEQISFLMFARLLDIREAREEKKAKRTHKDFRRTFPKSKQHLRWSQFNYKKLEIQR